MDDLISREKAIDALIACKGKDPFNRYEKQNIGLDWGIEALEQLPSAQADSKELSFTHKALDTISRQDAIRIVDGIDTWQAGWRGDAIESMKALPTAQPETHEERTETHACDCISRKEAIDAHYEYCNKHPDAGFPVWSLKILEDLPSAQPERQKGEWIDYTEDGYVECPFCHSATNCDGNKDELHFCFSCGADMRGKQDG